MKIAAEERQCLVCGQIRIATMQADECPNCGYLGWAEPGALIEAQRREGWRGSQLPFVLLRQVALWGRPF
jgi:hypothetical protein